MNTPFALPLRSEALRGGGHVLVAHDCELVCQTEASTDEEIAFIVMAVNAHNALLELIGELADYAESATLENDKLPPCVERAWRFRTRLEGTAA